MYLFLIAILSIDIQRISSITDLAGAGILYETRCTTDTKPTTTTIIIEPGANTYQDIATMLIDNHYISILNHSAVYGRDHTVTCVWNINGKTLTDKNIIEGETVHLFVCVI